MKQYREIKAAYPGALVLFRVGDFYETFGDDAIKASGILDITLTKRSNGSASEVELAGFPHHALDTYLPKLTRAGERVAICDQLEEPTKGKGIVRRGVTELVTPGVSSNDKTYESRSNNYLAAIHDQGNIFGIAFLDLSTGEFFVAQGNFDYIERLVKSLHPSEIIFSKAYKEKFDKLFGDEFYSYSIDKWFFEIEFAQDQLTRQLGVDSLRGFGIDHWEIATIAAGAAIHYLNQTHHNDLSHINGIKRLDEHENVWLDSFTIRNLEIIQSNHHNGYSLLDIIDHTLSPMGSRLLRKWLVLPLRNKTEIEERLASVEYLTSDKQFLKFCREKIKQIGDLERMISKVSLRKINPRELLQLAFALSKCQEIRLQGEKTECRPITQFVSRLHPMNEVIQLVNSHINPEAPVQLAKGGVIKKGVHAELDELLEISTNGKNYLLNLKNQEVERTGITSLKLAFNNVFGYYLEVTNTHKDKVPTEWIRKQTLVNAERYITPELKEFEEKILSAEEKINTIEQQLYDELLHKLNVYVVEIQNNSRLIAHLDCLASFAEVAIENNYTKPIILDDFALNIKDARHPVIEKQLPFGEEYIPNDIQLNKDDQQLIILTGPNMSGKSAILRQTALIALMAQVGSFVPARHAEIGIVDKIYTRVGASDNISQGESTFMVEMVETASILNNISDRSLIILDEIGRGTSTFDGVSLAWAIAEYILNHPLKPKTLFATHYHELNELEDRFPGITNYHITTEETKDKVIFLRKMKKGGSDRSFGIHVAKMAGIPKKVLSRASQILTQLEQERSSIDGTKTLKKTMPSTWQLSLFEVSDPKTSETIQLIKSLNIESLTPVEALIQLNEIKQALDN